MKTLLKKPFRAIMLGMFALCILGCGGCDKYVTVPTGYIAKLLTPTGWADGYITSGQANIKDRFDNGSMNRLVFLEKTSKTVYENFKWSGNLNEDDHRIQTDSREPLIIGIYLRMIVPLAMMKDVEQANGKSESQVFVDSIFRQITPKAIKSDSQFIPPAEESVQFFDDSNQQNSPDELADARLAYISVSDIYVHFARMDARSTIRKVFHKYRDFENVQDNLVKIQEELTKTLVEVFEKNGVPLTLQDVTVSNVQQDTEINNARNLLNSARETVKSIEAVGLELQRNPLYLSLFSWDVIKKKDVRLWVLPGK
jgi:hypothetical protein